MALIDEITQIGKKKQDNILSPIPPPRDVVNHWPVNDEPTSVAETRPTPLAPKPINYINTPWSNGKPIKSTPIQSAVDSGDYMAVLKQYFPKPDYEDEKKRAKRAQKGAFISDLARVVAQTGSSLGGSWMIPQSQDRTSAATANYNNVLAMEKAANRDYQGRLAAAALRGVELKKAQEAAKATRDFENMKFGYQVDKDNKELQLKLMEINNRNELGLISAEEKRKETNELNRVC